MIGLYESKFLAYFLDSLIEPQKELEMRLDDFHSNPSGRLVPTMGKHKAFVPDPLPPELDLTAILPEYQNAMLAIGELNGAIEPLANPELVIRPMQFREAISSSGMEGTYTTFEDLLVFDAGGPGENLADTKEVHNYLAALRAADDLLAELPVCIRLIQELHRLLLSGIKQKARGASIDPGRLKEHQNFIGGTKSNPRFIPPPPAEARVCLDSLEMFINRNDRPGMALIDTALIHYQFEAIHPFPDGNGRVGRILIPVYLKSLGVISGPYFYMSEYFERNKDAYIDHMYAVSARSAWDEWVRFFLTGVEESSRTAIRTAKQLISCGQNLREQIRQKNGKSAILTQIMDAFLSQPVLTVAGLVGRLSHSDQTIRNNLKWLVANGLVREIGTSRPKLFVSPDVMAIVSGLEE